MWLLPPGLRAVEAAGSLASLVRARRRRVSEMPTAAARLADPHAVLSRSDLCDLGWGRRAVDAIFRCCPVVVLPGYSRPVIRVGDYLELVEASTYRDGERVRLT